MILLENIRKSYHSGDGPTVDVLRGVSLRIQAGEFVAIVGSSGSGKSTLMNILGCLDRPTAGRYWFEGRDVAELGPDELARLRREAFGFIFQQYHLIRTESALENVEIPALYAGLPSPERRERATSLLDRLGLAERVYYRPTQLSGGQQQRVSIARALMNGGRIILADEPTGALDSRSGAEVMALLEQLAADGHTVILITHDKELAQRADRIIEMRDGQVVSDRRIAARQPALDGRALGAAAMPGAAVAAVGAEIVEASKAAWRALWQHRFRTSLTLLGIIIGVASVIVMLAVGEGSKRRVVEQLGAFGTNLLYISGQRGNARSPGGQITREDVQAIARLPQIAHAMPTIDGSVVVRRGNVDHATYASGVGVEMPLVQRWPAVAGAFFDAEDERSLATVVLLGSRVRDVLFPDGENPVGHYILVGSMPFRVIGVLAEKGATSGDLDDDDVVVMPFNTASARVFGQRNPRSVVVAVKPSAGVVEAETAVSDLLLERHRLKDFRIRNRAAMIEAEASAQDSLSLLLGMIAAISLLVGGIGVMNVMLMTVRERTREIGIRIATGARQRDIKTQFLTEAAVVSMLGGIAGVIAGLLIGAGLLVAGIPLVFSVFTTLVAFGCAALTGLIFGYFPALRAARLDPVAALASE